MKSLLFQPAKALWLHETGREAQTRRVIKHPEYYGCPTGDCPHERQADCNVHMNSADVLKDSPFKVGEKRYVKEPWRPYQGVQKEIIEYRGDGQFMVVSRAMNAHPDLDLNAEWTCLHDKGEHWRNPRFMPEWAARTILEVTSVRAELVCQISRQDAALEGICDLARAGYSKMHKGLYIIQKHRWPEENYRAMWESIHGRKAPWESTWVWVVGLRTVEIR
jgi:hypothetical protein